MNNYNFFPSIFLNLTEFPDHYDNICLGEVDASALRLWEEEVFLLVVVVLERGAEE